MRVSVIATAIVGMLGVFSAAASANGITNSGDDLRTGWYPNALISPQDVTGGTFGELWSSNVTGQVYAQPLVATNSDGSPESVIVTTEQNNVYALNPSTGATQWTANLGTPWNPADVGCADIQPYRGSTSTPVIDPSTNTLYMTHKTYSANHTAQWYLDAIDISTGVERTDFPVLLSGNADNIPALSFLAQTEEQRPGLLLMNGVVYAAFGGNCDYSPWQGWVFGVSASTGAITAKWADNPLGDGAGIWQAGVGLTSDGPNTLLFVTGNGNSPTTPATASSMPNAFGESVVRLNVQSNGQLAAADFFAPFDATQLDGWDADFGAGAVVGLPQAEFGTAALPDLGVADGKEGYVYLLNLQNLGGFEQGAGGGDDVVQRLGPFGGVWGRAGVWPGDGGYIYIPTSTGLSNGGLLDVYKYGVNGSGAPTLAADGNASTAFGWGSGSPLITSAGTTSGSAVLWMIYSPNRTGAGAQLQAYDPIPFNGTLQEIYSAAIGTSTNYSMPGVGDNGKLYVGTRTGTVIAFGSPVTEPVNGSALTFPATETQASSSPQTLTLTAYKDVTISSIASTSSQFTLGSPSTTLPAALTTGQTITVPVTFAPTQTGQVGGAITVTTDSGTVSIPVSGTGEATSPQLISQQRDLSLGGTTVGNTLSGTITFSNDGNAPLTITNVKPPSAPFSAVGAPAQNSTLNPGQSVTVEIDFNPTTVGQFSDALELDSSGGNVTLGVAGSAATPPAMVITSESTTFGDVVVGQTVSKTFTIKNTGGSDLLINKSKPPFGGAFSATTSLPEGTTIPAGQSVTETVQFTPTAAGAATGEWDITGNDGSGLQQVQFSGTGMTPPSMVISSESNSFGDVTIGQTATKTFTVSNTGGSDLTITHSRAPTGDFSATSTLPTDTTIPAGQSVTESVQFTPTAAGAATGEWDITGNDGSGLQQVQFSGTGVEPASVATSTTPSTTTTTTTSARPSTTTTTTTSAGPNQTTTSGSAALPSHASRLAAPTIWPAATTDAVTRHSYITYTALIKRSSHFTLEHGVAGRTSGGSCVALTARDKHSTPCTRWVVLKSFTHADTRGVNQLWVVAVMPHDRLVSGTYRLLSKLFDASGHSHTFVTVFRIG